MAQLYGVYTATVVDVKDPKQLGRVRVRVAALEAPGLDRRWARPATLMAGAGRGTWFVPDVGDEVLVVFERGDVRRPFVLGALWNPSAKPPERMDKAGKNPRRVIRTRGGHRLAFDDGDQRIEIQDANGNSVELDAQGVKIQASGRVRISGATVEIDAGLLTVSSGMAKFSGVVQTDTLIANSVISASYTPGVGNIQ
jgi:phage baseplate assembly protein V